MRKISQSSPFDACDCRCTHKHMHHQFDASKKQHLPLQCCIQMFFGHTILLMLRIGQFSDTQKPQIVVAECPKIFDVQCIWGRIFVSLEKIFVFKYLQTIFNLVSTSNICAKSVAKTFLGTFFWCIYHSSIWMWHCFSVYDTYYLGH